MSTDMSRVNDGLSMESSAIAFAGSLKAAVKKAIDIDNGAKAVAKYRACGLITFPEDRNDKTPRRPCHFHSKEERIALATKALEMYNAGTNWGKIAAELKVSETSLCQWATRYGLREKREPGFGKQKRAKLIAKAIELYKAGKNCRQITEELGPSETTIRKWMVDAGLRERKARK